MIIKSNTSSLTYEPRSITKDSFFLMPKDYQESCIRIMAITAYAEHLGGDGFSRWVPRAPDNPRGRLVAKLAYDELDHGYRMYRLLEDLGVTEGLANSIALGKSGSGGSIHNSIEPAELTYGTKSGDHWLDFALHCILMDGAGRFVVSNFTLSSYAPWAEVAETIILDEKMHEGFGKRELTRCIKEGVSIKLLQERFDFWYAKSLNFFGPPAGETSLKLQKYGIKRKNNDTLRFEFMNYIVDYLKSIDFPAEIKLKRNTYPFE